MEKGKDATRRVGEVQPGETFLQWRKRAMKTIVGLYAMPTEQAGLIEEALDEAFVCGVSRGVGQCLRAGRS